MKHLYKTLGAALLAASASLCGYATPWSAPAQAEAEATASTTYDGFLTINMMGADIAANQQAQVIITDIDATTCNFALPNFALDLGDGPVPLGDIIVNGVTKTAAAAGATDYAGEVKGMELLDGAIVADVTLSGSISALGEANMNIQVLWQEIPINVTFVSRYDGYLNVEMMGMNIVENQAAAVSIVPAGEGLCTFTLPNFAIDLGEGPMPLGDIKVDNVAVTTTADGAKAYAGEVKGMQLLDGAIVADVTLQGTMSPRGQIDMAINVVWVMDAETTIPINVSFTTPYQGYLTVNMLGNAIVENQAAKVIITPGAENTCTFLLPDFAIDLGDGPVPLGDIKVDNVAVTTAADGAKAYAGQVKGMELLGGAIVADVTLEGLVAPDGTADMKISVIWDMGEQQIPIDVTFTSDPYEAPEPVEYPGYLNVEMNEAKIVENQQAKLLITETGDGLGTVVLPDFAIDLGDGPVTLGDIVVENVKIEKGAYGTTLQGEKKGMGLLGGALQADVTLVGVISLNGDVDMVINVLWENIPIVATFTTDEVNAIQSVEADANAPVEYYDLQGRRVVNPEGGIFIRRQGAKTAKVAL